MIKSLAALSLFIFVLPLSLQAQNKGRTEKDRFGIMSVGMDFRAEKDAENSTLPRTWPTFSFGVGQKPWLLSLEYGSFSESSGNSSLSVNRKSETLLLWGQWLTSDPWLVQPFMGVGLGTFRSSADFRLYDEQNSAQGKWIEHLAGSVGVKLNNIAPFWVSAEARVHMNRELVPSPTIGALIKLGFVID